MLNNSDKLDHLIALAAMKCIEEEANELDGLDTSSVCFDASYYRKRSKMIRKYKNIRIGRSSSKSIVVRLAVAIAIVILTLSLLIGCVPGLGQRIYNAIFGWYDRYFTVHYESPSGQEKETSYSDESESESEATVTPPTIIENFRKPTDLPGEVWEDLIVKNNAKMSIDYYIGDEWLFSFTQFTLEPFDKYIDNEDGVVTYTHINGNYAAIVEYASKKETNILWNDGEYSYHIFSTQCDVDTLLKYAESVK